MGTTLYKINTNKVKIKEIIEKYKKENEFLSIFDYKNEEEASSLLLKLMLAKNNKKKYRDFKFNEYGAPSLEGINFSISHANGLTILVTSDYKIGVDTLNTRETNKRVVDKYFSFSEMYYLDKAESLKKKDELFTFIWSLKESVGKYYGIGISEKAMAYGLELDKYLVINYRTKEEFNFLKTYVDDQLVTIISKEKIPFINVIDINESKIIEFIKGLNDSIS